MVGQRPAAFYRRPRVGQHRRMSMTGRVAVRTRSRTGRSLLGDATTAGWVRVVVGVRTTEHRALRHVPLQDALGTLLLLARSRSQHRRTDGGHLGRGRQRHMYGALNTQTRVQSSNHQFQRPLGLSRIVVIIIIINKYYSAVGSKKTSRALNNRKKTKPTKVSRRIRTGVRLCQRSNERLKSSVFSRRLDPRGFPSLCPSNSRVPTNPA